MAAPRVARAPAPPASDTLHFLSRVINYELLRTNVIEGVTQEVLYL